MTEAEELIQGDEPATVAAIVASRPAPADIRPFNPNSATLVTFSLTELLNLPHLAYVRFAPHRRRDKNQQN